MIQQQWHLDIFVGRQRWDEREELKDESQRAFAQVRPLIAVKFRDILSID